LNADGTLLTKLRSLFYAAGTINVIFNVFQEYNYIDEEYFFFDY
jgi:hypothetical protein